MSGDDEVLIGVALGFALGAFAVLGFVWLLSLMDGEVDERKSS
jgi:hypothetical protein